MADEFSGKAGKSSVDLNSTRGSRWTDELQDEESSFAGDDLLKLENDHGSYGRDSVSNYSRSAISGMPSEKKEEIPASGRARKPAVSGQKSGSAGQKRRRRRKKSFRRRLRAHIIRIVFLAVVILAAVGIIFGVRALFTTITGGHRNASLPDYVKEDLLTVNPNSRPGNSVQNLNGIVIHQAPAKGETAEELRTTWENLKDEGTERESSNFIIDIDGDVILCVPVGEIAYASDSRNTDTVSVTYCYDTDDGSLSEEARASLVSLTEWLCSQYEIDPSNVIRHYDINGRNCPAYYVANPDVWDSFITEIGGTPASETESAAEVETDENGETISSSESGSGSTEESSSPEEDLAVDG